jgi:hypothetical protein
LQEGFFNNASKHIEGVHIKSQVQEIGMNQSGREETIPLTIVNNRGWMKDQVIDESIIRKSQKR